MKLSGFVLFLLLLAQINFGQASISTKRTSTAEILPGANQISQYLPLLKGKSVAIFANQTSMVASSHLVDTLIKRGVNIRKIFSPEHGFRGTADAGEQVANLIDPSTGVPIISLYGNNVKPIPADLKGIDIMIFDIQDVGVRFYTYISSLEKYMEAALENNKTLIVLDRPNPNGFYVDGPILDTGFKSFVGMQAVPVVYGMTIGEYAKMLVGEKLVRDPKNNIKTFKLIVIPNKNYSHNSRYQLPVRPSPNLPNMQSVYLYPSICFFEGTAVSLGRGTDKPFQQFGHPSFPSNLYSFTPRSTEGAKSPPMMNQLCYGFDLSELNIAGPEYQHIQLKWLLQAYALFGDQSKFFLASNYINRLAGSDALATQIKVGKTEAEIKESWEPGLRQFKKIRKKYLLYTDFE
jgi:uncharacterized protein YbbC (DUF1343 family)